MHLILPLPPMASRQLYLVQLAVEKIWLVHFECQRGKGHPITFQDFFFPNGLCCPNDFYGLYRQWNKFNGFGKRSICRASLPHSPTFSFFQYKWDETFEFEPELHVDSELSHELKMQQHLVEFHNRHFRCIQALLKHPFTLLVGYPALRCTLYLVFLPS